MYLLSSFHKYDVDDLIYGLSSCYILNSFIIYEKVSDFVSALVTYFNRYSNKVFISTTIRMSILHLISNNGTIEYWLIYCESPDRLASTDSEHVLWPVFLFVISVYWQVLYISGSFGNLPLHLQFSQQMWFWTTPLRLLNSYILTSLNVVYKLSFGV
jgi:hypothetical protein